ncbi:MAG: hypothetical protein KAI94_14525, partial [Anaerolineales bacterium]|nr:hypothetical protein [Anaerolineales bacterium]
MSISDSEKTTVVPDAETLRQVAQTLGIGIAIVEPDDWTVLFENANFFKWFPPGSEVDEPLTKRLHDLKADRALSRLQNGRPYKFETEAQSSGRSIPVAVELRELSDSSDQIVVECHNISKQKQAEYMLESYSKMAEKNAREVEREKDRVERLLLNIMPKSVYEEMKDYGTVTPQLFPNASILMVDFVG